jgi:hypothetical protein
LYTEQLVIGFPLTLHGLAGTTAVIQPPGLKKNNAVLAAAAIIVAQTSGVTISDLTVDVSNNLINGCDVPLAGILFQNSSGRIPPLNDFRSPTQVRP